jgi:O-antigen/teichoic acid export membrane protein
MTPESPADPSAENAPAVKRESHAVFFRQSGWIMLSGVVGGLLMSGVHFLSHKISKDEYAIFGTLLSVITMVPTVPLQMVFAQQTAAALATNRKRQLTGMIRSAWAGTFVLWIVGAALALLFQDRIISGWNLSNPAALPLTLFAVLLSLWIPMFSGTMQGQQNFFWLGWMQMFGSMSRVGAAFLIVLALQGKGTGMVAAVVIGSAVICAMGIWHTRLLWRGKAEAFHWGNLLKQVVPLMLGFAACQFLFTGDTMFVKYYFDSQQAAPYVAAGTLARALLWFVMPLASVMFPKIVHSAARSEKTNLQGLVLIGTAVLATGGIFGLWLFGPFVLKVMFGADYVSEAMTVLLWYAGAMVPLSLANVLVNDLLARSRFGIVPVMVLLAILYGFALTRLHGSLVQVLQTLGFFNLLLFGVCAWFTWGVKPRAPRDLKEPAQS